MVFSSSINIPKRVTKADKVTGDIDFEYVKSELDLVERNLKSKKEKGSRRRPSDKKEARKTSRDGNNHSESTQRKKQRRKSKKKKPFYTAAAKGKFGNRGKKKSKKY